MDEHLFSPGSHQPDTGTFPGGRERASGGRRADGDAVGPARGRNTDGTPRFDQAVAAGSYLWWYVDGLSDCGRHAITLIAFIGSVFSPYYAWARERSERGGPPANPENHCALNVALYTPGRKRWTMTERSRASIERDARNFRIGPSHLHWNGSELVIQIDEVFRAFTENLKREIRTMAVYGGVSINPQMKGMFGVEILVATPGRLLDLII